MSAATGRMLARHQSQVRLDMMCGTETFRIVDDGYEGRTRDLRDAGSRREAHDVFVVEAIFFERDLRREQLHVELVECRKQRLEIRARHVVERRLSHALNEGPRFAAGQPLSS